MPRRTPGAIRAAGPRGHESLHAVLDTYRNMLRRPGRYLHLYPESEVFWDVVTIRDQLEQELVALSPRRRRQFRRVVEPLDDELRRRTLPDPDAAATSPWHAAAWWRQRLRGW